MNIVVLEGQVNNPGDLSWDALDRFGTVTVYDRTSRDQLKTRVAEADIVVSSKTEWNAEALGWAPRLKMIALTSTGYNVVDLDAARDAGVIVSNVPAYSTPDVAQMTFALLLELCLHVGEHSNLVMEGDWTRAKDFSFWNTPLVELAGKTMGIVGMGSIGQAVCRIARAFGMPVVFENRSAKPQLESDGVRQVSLDELLAVSDVVTLHAPATPETDRMMNAQTIGRMKDGAYLLNTARAGGRAGRGGRTAIRQAGGFRSRCRVGGAHATRQPLAASERPEHHRNAPYCLGYPRSPRTLAGYRDR